MNNSRIKLISLIILVLSGGITLAWYFSTSETFSRPLQDSLGMLVLLSCFLIAGILIIALLIQIQNQP